MIEEKIEAWVKMINAGFSLEQIQKECWNYIHREGLGILAIESMIFKSMVLYAEIIKRSGK